MCEVLGLTYSTEKIQKNYHQKICILWCPSNKPKKPQPCASLSSTFFTLVSVLTSGLWHSGNCFVRDRAFLLLQIRQASFRQEISIRLLCYLLPRIRKLIFLKSLWALIRKSLFPTASFRNLNREWHWGEDSLWGNLFLYLSDKCFYAWAKEIKHVDDSSETLTWGRACTVLIMLCIPYCWALVIEDNFSALSDGG